MRPCVKCLEKTPFRKRSGVHCIIQCSGCGFNVSATEWKEADAKWDDFKVWKLVAEEDDGDK